MRKTVGDPYKLFVKMSDWRRIHQKSDNEIKISYFSSPSQIAYEACRHPPPPFATIVMQKHQASETYPCPHPQASSLWPPHSPPSISPSPPSTPTLPPPSSPTPRPSSLISRKASPWANPVDAISPYCSMIITVTWPNNFTFRLFNKACSSLHCPLVANGLMLHAHFVRTGHEVAC